MSSDRFGSAGRNGALKPALASNRTSTTPLTPRLAGNANPPTPSLTARRGPILPSESTKNMPRVKEKEGDNIVRSALPSPSITPRSPAGVPGGKSTMGTPSMETRPNLRPRSVVMTAGSNASGRTGPSGTVSRKSRPNSFVGDTGIKSASPSLIRSPGQNSSTRSSQDQDADAGFFHASDVSRSEPALRRAETKKPAAFFYADGQKEDRKRSLSPKPSPVLSSVSDQRSTVSRFRVDKEQGVSNGSPMISPALTALSGQSPFFAPAASRDTRRSPSPSKENIHLSYRKGASQIFGAKPPSVPRPEESQLSTSRPQRPNLTSPALRTPHRKSPSLSSIDSGSSILSRRRSATTAEVAQTPSPLAQEPAPSFPPVPSRSPRLAKNPVILPSIDTSLEPTAHVGSPPETTLSPTKGAADLAADARRERKVLDLEISNSSLLAINASLEREMRRQKVELKRFRRLSRAGRFSLASSHQARQSEGLSALGEENDDTDYAVFGPPSGFTDVYDDLSDEDEESITSGGEPLSPGSVHKSRLERDDKRLQVDLAKHKELLVHSQMMNQSLKRCMYAAEEMIKEGKRALQYHVRVSDVKLGGRILNRDDDDDEEQEEIDIDEDLPGNDSMEHAKGFVEVWSGLGGFEGSESGDRDSGIEVDNAPQHVLLPSNEDSNETHNTRPPEEQP